MILNEKPNVPFLYMPSDDGSPCSPRSSACLRGERWVRCVCRAMHHRTFVWLDRQRKVEEVVGVGKVDLDVFGQAELGNVCGGVASAGGSRPPPVSRGSGAFAARALGADSVPF